MKNRISAGIATERYKSEESSPEGMEDNLEKLTESLVKELTPDEAKKVWKYGVGIQEGLKEVSRMVDNIGGRYDRMHVAVETLMQKAEEHGYRV